MDRELLLTFWNDLSTKLHTCHIDRMPVRPIETQNRSDRAQRTLSVQSGSDRECSVKIPDYRINEEKLKPRLLSMWQEKPRNLDIQENQVFVDYAMGVYYISWSAGGKPPDLDKVFQRQQLHSDANAR